MDNEFNIEFKPLIHITSNISIGDVSFNGHKYNAFRIDTDNPETALKQINNSKYSDIIDKYFCSETDPVIIRPQKGDIHIVNDSSSKYIVFFRRIPEGTTWDQKLKENLSFNDFLEFFLKIVNVVQKAHKINLHHGWLNPHNIYIASDGGISIAGWEECTFTKQALKSSSGSDLIELDSIYEKYASPESKTIKTSIDEQSDVYSLGRIFEDGLKIFKDESQNNDYQQFIEKCTDKSSDKRWLLTQVNNKVSGFIEQLPQPNDAPEEPNVSESAGSSSLAWVLEALLLITTTTCIGLAIFAFSLKTKNADLQNQIETLNNELSKAQNPEPGKEAPQEPAPKSEPATEPSSESVPESTDKTEPQTESDEDITAKIDLVVENATGKLYEDVSNCILAPNYKDLFVDKLNKWDPANQNNIEKKAELLDKLNNFKSPVVLKDEKQKLILNKLIDRLQAATKSEEQVFISKSQEAINEAILEEYFDFELVVNVIKERIKRAIKAPKIQNSVENQKESLAFIDSLCNSLPLQQFKSQPKLHSFCENYKNWYSDKNKISYELTSINAKLTTPKGEKSRAYVKSLTPTIEAEKAEKNDKLSKFDFDNSYFDKDTVTLILKKPYQFEITPKEVFRITSMCCLNSVWEYPTADINLVPFYSQSEPSCKVQFEKDNSVVTLKLHFKVLNGKTAEDIYNEAFDSKPTSKEVSPSNEQQESDNNKAITEDADNKDSEQSVPAEPDAQ